jgi:hypothetical protein
LFLDLVLINKFSVSQDSKKNESVVFAAKIDAILIPHIHHKIPAHTPDAYLACGAAPCLPFPCNPKKHIAVFK